MPVKHLLAALLPVMLAGCQTPPAPANHAIPVRSAQQLPVQQLTATQQSLAAAGHLNQASSLFARHITSNTQRISVSWDGDAAELLAQLARQRGLKFATSGPRLPLPVTLHVRNVTVNDLLRIIATQTNWRARIDQQYDALHIYYQLPLRGGVA